MDALAILQQISDRYGITGQIAEIMGRASEILGESALETEARLVGSVDGAPGDVDEVCRHILRAGGKRIRPMMCLLAHRAAGGRGDPPLDLAVSCELLHNASLLHDDVIDEGDLRRGRPAARVVYGNALSILGGDYLLMKCVEIVSVASPELMPRFVSTLKALVEGEVVQLSMRGSAATTEEQYFKIIGGKTASLFSWAAESGAFAAGAGEATRSAFGRFGWHVGEAFQLVDDVLDFTADPEALGKELLADVSEGKITLPVILAAERRPELTELLEELVEGDGAPEISVRIADVVSETGMSRVVMDRAARHTDEAIETISSLEEGDPEMIAHLADLSRALLAREM